ncbi:MAG: hypothetical protein DMF63_09370 [Acidobacteria bacterium]|nr:MAG: hypothetical protein DMF63_09370 [Acidobacteriota bacterium]
MPFRRTAAAFRAEVALPPRAPISARYSAIGLFLGFIGFVGFIVFVAFVVGWVVFCVQDFFDCLEVNNYVTGRLGKKEHFLAVVRYTGGVAVVNLVNASGCRLDRERPERIPANFYSYIRFSHFAFNSL